MNPAFSVLRSAGIVAAFSALGYGSFIYVVRFGNMDPFAKYRNVTKLDMQTGIELGNVVVSEFHEGKRVAYARVGKIKVSQDRSSLALSNVHDGWIKSGTPVHFAADHGAWNVQSQELELSGLTRVAGKDFDLQSTSAIFSRTAKTMSVPAAVHGRLFGGKVRASQLLYSAKTGDASARFIRWQGKPAGTALNGIQEARGQDQIVVRSWDIECDYSQKHGDTSVYHNAKATDGEILVMAPKVEWNRTTDVLTATGRISYFSGKADVLADKVVVFRKEKKASFTGSVLMLVKAKKDQDKPPASELVPEIKKEEFNEGFKLGDQPTVISSEDKKKVDDLRSGKNFRDYPVHVQADDIVYWYGKGSRHATFDGSPVARQEFPSGQWRMGWSFDGAYDGEKELLNLTSQLSKRQVRYKNSVGDIAQASKAEFSTKDSEKEDDEDLQFWDVSGIFKDSSGEDTRDPKKPAPAGPVTAPPVSKPSR